MQDAPSPEPRPVAAETLEQRLRRSEDELTAVLDAMPDLYYRTDAEGRLVRVSQACLAIFGVAPEDARGRPVVDFYADPAERNRFFEELEAGGGAVHDFVSRMRRVDGSVVWISTSSCSLTDENGAFAGVSGIVRDITARHQYEQRQIESANLVQALLDASTDAIMLFHPDGPILAVNTVFASRVGKAPEELVGVDLYSLFPKDVAEARRAVVVDAVSRNCAVHLTDQRDGRHLHNSIYPVANADGEIDKVAVYSRDITDRVQGEERIAAYIAEIERSNEDLERFAYVASHDLREPLRMIGSYVGLLERRLADSLDDDTRAFMGYARQGVTRLDALIKDLLSYSRLDSETERSTPADPVEAAEEAVEHLRLALDDCGAHLEIARPMPAVLARRSQLVSVFQNLIANAIKYRRPDGVPSIRVGWRRDDAAFYVADNGIGIDPLHHDRVFQIFQRLGGAWSTEGTGIGLAVCRKIVSRHGGQMWVESEEGQGATFLFTLPMA